MIHTYSFSITINNCYIKFFFTSLFLFKNGSLQLLCMFCYIALSFFFPSGCFKAFLTIIRQLIIVSLNKIFFCWQNLVIELFQKCNWCPVDNICLLLFCVLITLCMFCFYMTMYSEVSSEIKWLKSWMLTYIIEWNSVEDLLIYGEYIYSFWYFFREWNPEIFHCISGEMHLSKEQRQVHLDVP